MYRVTVEKGLSFHIILLSLRQVINRPLYGNICVHSDGSLHSSIRHRCRKETGVKATQTDVSEGKQDHFEQQKDADRPRQNEELKPERRSLSAAWTWFRHERSDTANYAEYMLD